MTQYDVRARLWEQGYELHITGPDDFQGCTQSQGLGDAVRMAKDYVHLSTGLPLDRIGVTVKIDLGREPKQE